MSSHSNHALVPSELLHIVKEMAQIHAKYKKDFRPLADWYFVYRITDKLEEIEEKGLLNENIPDGPRPLFPLRELLDLSMA